jgi:hypothetical protein
MTQASQVWIPLLLADPSPNLRLLVLRELLHRPPDDPEVRELLELREADPLVTDLLVQQQADGSWSSEGVELRGDAPRATAQALARLGYLGFGPNHPAVQRGTDYLFSLQRKDGSWPMPGTWKRGEGGESYSMIPLQTALPLRALAACGYAADPRAERAYEWLLASRLPDGAWPTGTAGGTYGRVGGYRRLAHSRWGCRSNTTGALGCLVLHPGRCQREEARRALDLLLGRETRDKHALGFELARLLGAEPVRGFLTYHARFDVGLVLDMCWRAGATRSDERVAALADWVLSLQSPYGLWEYPPRPQISRWVTFDLLRSLSRLDRDADWLSLEPRTPFRAYPKRYRRY